MKARSRQVKQSPPAAPARAGWWLGASAAVVAVAAFVRYLAAARNDFWLDEIWTLKSFALAARSPLDVFVRMPHSNNHHLLTLWMYLWGDQENWLIYRLPSLLAGIGSVILAGQIARRWGNFAMLAAVVLTGASSFLITYASEARGYAMCGFFALAAFALLDRYLQSRRWWDAVGFNLCVLLGFLSHLGCVFFYAGAGAWSVLYFARHSSNWRGAVGELLRCHALGVAGLAVFYFTSLRGYIVGGAPDYSMPDVIARTLAICLGVAPFEISGAIAAAVVTGCLAAVGIYLLWRSRDELWAFFAVTLVVMPALVLLTQPSALYERFFYINILFFLLLFVYLLAKVYQSRWAGLAISALLLVTLANALNLRDFLTYGRGGYADALRFMVEQSSHPKVLITSDHHFRNPMVLEYYSRQLGDRPIAYFSGDAEVPADLEWIILHSFDFEWRPPRQMTDDNGGTYTLARVYPYAGLSGFSWAIYRRDPSPAPSGL